MNTEARKIPNSPLNAVVWNAKRQTSAIEDTTKTVGLLQMNHLF
jgi:hypothetical protein